MFIQINTKQIPSTDEDTDNPLNIHITNMREVLQQYQTVQSVNSSYKAPEFNTRNYTYEEVILLTGDRLNTLEKMKKGEAVTKKEKELLLEMDIFKKDDLITNYRTTNKVGLKRCCIS